MFFFSSGYWYLVVMVVKYRVVLSWVACLLFKVVLVRCEVTLVNRNVTDSFRVGENDCRRDADCSLSTTSSATCQSDSGLCLCKDGQPNFFLYDLSGAVDYRCVTSLTIQVGVGGYLDCLLGPFQPILYTPNEPATKFTDRRQSNLSLTSCSLQKALVKFPDNLTEMELQWLDESYVDLTVLNKTLHFKWKKSVPGLQGTIVTLDLYCLTISGGSKGSYRPCLRAKVLGKWPPDTIAVPTDPTVTSSHPKSSQKDSKTSVQLTTVTTEKPKSILNASSTEDCSYYQLLSNIFIALFSVSFTVNIVLIIFTMIYLRKICRMQDKNVKMKEMNNTEQQRKSRTGDEIEPYDEVVARGGIRNQGLYNEPFSSSSDNNKTGHLSNASYEEPYEPLRRNPLQDQREEHKYQSLKK